MIYTVNGRTYQDLTAEEYASIPANYDDAIRDNGYSMRWFVYPNGNKSLTIYKDDFECACGGEFVGAVLWLNSYAHAYP